MQTAIGNKLDILTVTRISSMAKTIPVNGELIMLDRKLVGYDLEKSKKRFNDLFAKIEPVAEKLSKEALKKQNN